jgi:hypothetical protein
MYLMDENNFDLNCYYGLTQIQLVGQSKERKPNYFEIDKNCISLGCEETVTFSLTFRRLYEPKHIRMDR